MLGIFGVYIKLLFLILGITALIFIVLDAFVCFKKDSGDGEPLFYDSLSSSTKDEDKKKEVSLSAYSENVEREVKNEDEYFQAPPDNEEDLESLQKSFLAAVSNIKTVEKEKEVSSIEQNIEEAIDYSQLIEDCQDEIIFGISDYENVDLI